MIEKTRGIVLHNIKYSDSGIVVQLYTRKFGRQSFLVKGIRARKKDRQAVFFQPMFILDTVIYFRESREMQILKEFSSSFSPADLYANIKKSCVAIFLGEVLTSVLKEETPNEDLFDYIEQSIRYFDGCKEGYANFHIAFLAGLCSYLGFEPGARTEKENIFFDMMNGVFVEAPPGHSHYCDSEISNTLDLIFSSTYDTINDIPLNGNRRNEVLDIIVQYYSLHLPGLKKINSLTILKEVFS